MIFYITIIIWIFLDLLSKQLAKNLLQENINIIWNYFYLWYIENRWIAFSINIPFLKITTIFLISLIFFYYFKEEKKKNDKIIDLSFWLILAWALWNWYERIFNSYVVDFIWVKYFSVFNLADSFIFIWALIYLIKFFFTKNNLIKK